MINSVGKYSGLPKDYYSLVAKAVAALAPNTAKTRGDLYAHVRRMLGDQLRLANLPTPKFDICAEQSALEKSNSTGRSGNSGDKYIARQFFLD
jgi:hypothetical protein